VDTATVAAAAEALAGSVERGEIEPGEEAVFEAPIV
jgi:hypothetical protein